MDTPLANASARLGERDDLARDISGHLVSLRWMPVTVAGEPHKAAGTALGQVVLRHHSRDRRTLGLWG